MLDSIDDPLTGIIRRLRLADQLFVHAEDWWMNACVNWYHDPTEVYVSGYKEAGDTLVDSVADRSGTADTLFFPILFVYRHYIELRLKSLLHGGHRLFDQEHDQQPEHRLSKLWPKVRGILVELWPDGNEEDFATIDSLVTQFEQIDPRSTTFRYSRKLEGEKSLDIESRRISLRHLKEVVGAMSIILEGSAAAISDYQGYKNDMQRDYW